ncbi:MAG TPA: ROK family protein [Crenotrichaceae bacterium]|nr:ROK family protein [Crenotrichaceae bacterium]
MEQRIHLGIDLGGTKIELLALDKDSQEHFRKRIATPQGDYPATINAIVSLIADAEQALGVQGHVGIGTPGAVSQLTGSMKNCNSVWLNNQPLRSDLENRLKRPVRIANDANCFALSEATDGAGAGVSVVFGVILGTGVGAGLVVNGRIINGVNGIAGEWGHNPLPWPTKDEFPGSYCYCGNRGCIETWLSGPGLVKDYQRSLNSLPGQKDDLSLTAQEIIAQANNGHAHSLLSLNRYVDRLSRGLAHVINIIDPDVIVLGGGMSNCDYLYTAVTDNWLQYVFSDEVKTQLIAPEFGDSSGVRGAAWLAATIDSD